jgi:cytochrome c oxidase assembly protein subunit 15
MHSTLPDHDRRQSTVRLWLLGVAGLIFAMVLIGGGTRLTESGLSIVEWQPVTGTMPPLSEAAWQAEFEKYQRIPQYQQVNRGMTLADFKVIYWWEWTHRFLGRLIGVAFLAPFLWFLWRGWIGPGLRWRLWAIFALGALQGAVGWWMVASGLTERTSVSQYRLAFHLTLACAIYAAVLWTAQRLVPRPIEPAQRRLATTAFGLVVLMLAQIYLGALVAGLRAGLIYNTWPLIDGALVPKAAALFFHEPWWRNFFENTLTTQFNHRMMAYAILAVAMLHLIDAWRTGSQRWIAGAAAVFAAVTLQSALGVVTLLQQAPLPLALAHQGMAMVVLTVVVMHGERLAHRQPVLALGATRAA